MENNLQPKLTDLNKEYKGNYDMTLSEGLQRLFGSFKNEGVCSCCGSTDKTSMELKQRVKISMRYNNGVFNDYELLDGVGANGSLCSKCASEKLTYTEEKLEKAILEAANVDVFNLNDNIPYETMEGKSYVYQMSKYVKNVEDLEEVTKLLKEVISEMKIYTAWSGYDVLIIKSYEVYRSAFDLYQPKLRVECILKTKVK